MSGWACETLEEGNQKERIEGLSPAGFISYYSWSQSHKKPHAQRALTERADGCARIRWFYWLILVELNRENSKGSQRWSQHCHQTCWSIYQALSKFKPRSREYMPSCHPNMQTMSAEAAWLRLRCSLSLRVLLSKEWARHRLGCSSYGAPQHHRTWPL